ncbi:AAA family ATPase [Haematospirillum sp. H1815]|uniref:Lon protease family protein n=1 Tax=Haematospirillum sp. H1815 TaxID=2723108 RepID=UPI00143CBE2C|nr:AAA family ATPase [Haematospirillum sp. H1815]NKD76997.1 AAA family ATPase [Haematospirillum sp. H1815]
MMPPARTPVTSLDPEILRRTVHPAEIPFAISSDLPPSHEETLHPVGQSRAVEAVHFAISMSALGYNLFCMGPEGTGKASLIRRFVGEAAASRSPARDWCYVYNFEDNYRPKALGLPAGRARAFAKAMAALVEELRHALPAAFETEEYHSRQRNIEEDFRQRRETALDEHRRAAEADGIALVRTPMGLTLAPERNGEALGPDDFSHLPEDEQKALKETISRLQDALEETVRRIPQWEREKREQGRILDHELTGSVLDREMASIRGAFSGDDCREAMEYLDAVRADILENSVLFLPDGDEDDDENVPAMIRKAGDDLRFRRYHVNVLIDHGDAAGAPLIIEDHPTQPGLVGRIEYRQHLGTLSTDFHLLRPGALHRANGGFLVMEARKLMANPFAWEDLKRSLRNREIRIEAPGTSWGIMSTQSMEPEPIPLNLKVVLLGEPALYYLLAESDPDFRELFKVVADFDTVFPREPRTIRGMSLLLAEIGQRKNLPPLEAEAVACIIEHGSRLAEDAGKLTASVGALTDLLREAAWVAGQEACKTVQAKHVKKAIQAQRRRSDRIPVAMQEDITRNTITIQTDGSAVGQVNGLAIIGIGTEEFGKPSRITARVRVGRGDFDDIEREVDLGGPTHSKGMLILSSFLRSRFGNDGPILFSASITFEQSYGMIDGDSASSTELYALLSALADTPVDQGKAVTGSVDQFGAVQAVGGINEKIEGFFDLCEARSLTGRQGVIIPQTNIINLMLREDVVDACRRQMFHVWPITHVDDGIALLTGLPAGEQDSTTGQWTPGSINRRIASRLKTFARIAAQEADGNSDSTGSWGGTQGAAGDRRS